MRDRAAIPFSPKPRYTRSSPALGASFPGGFALPRPLSWLPRLATIRRTVAGSPRSHYARPDLERLFEIQPRSAQKLLEALPTLGIGTSHLAARDDLLALLDAMRDADDPAAVLALAQTKARAPAPSRRSLRQLLPADLPPAGWETLPAALTLAPGEVKITFTRVEELAAALAALASLLEHELEVFAERFEVRQEPPSIDEQEDAEALLRELRLLEAGSSDL